MSLITISDAIGFSESHRNLMPTLRDLLEANIKRERQLLLTWKNPLLLTSSSCTAHQSFKYATTPMALGRSFAVMTIALAETLIALGTSIVRCK